MIVHDTPKPGIDYHFVPPTPWPNEARTACDLIITTLARPNSSPRHGVTTNPDKVTCPACLQNLNAGGAEAASQATRTPASTELTAP